MFKSINRVLSKIKHKEIILVVLLGIVMLAIYFYPTSATEKTEVMQQTDISDELSDILSTVKGAGKVKVYITYQNNGELVPAYNTEKNETTKTDDTQSSYSQNTSNKIITVYDHGNTTALVLANNNPTVKGVIVVAQGAGDISVKLDIYRAVQTVLQITADKVEVLEMK